MEMDLAPFFRDECNATDLADYYHLKGEHIDHTILSFSGPDKPGNFTAISPLMGRARTS